MYLHNCFASKKQNVTDHNMESSTTDHNFQRLLFDRNLSDLKERSLGNPVDMPFCKTVITPTVPKRKVRAILSFLCYVLLLLH